MTTCARCGKHTRDENPYARGWRVLFGGGLICPACYHETAIAKYMTVTDARKLLKDFQANQKRI